LNKYFLNSVLSLALIFNLSYLFAQEEFNNDPAAWLSIRLEKKINKHFTIQLNQHNRINENLSKYGRGNIDFGMAYIFNKNIKIMFDYVYVEKRKLDDNYATRSQFFIALVLKKEFGKWTIIYRNMFQARLKEYYEVEKNGEPYPEFYERNRLTLRYKINKIFTPYIAQEIYYPLYQAKNKGFDRSRTYFGLTYHLNKQTSFGSYFLYQRELNSFNATNIDYVYGLIISHDF